jgi:hypothetical protein
MILLRHGHRIDEDSFLFFEVFVFSCPAINLPKMASFPFLEAF